VTGAQAVVVALLIVGVGFLGFRAYAAATGRYADAVWVALVESVRRRELTGVVDISRRGEYPIRLFVDAMQTAVMHSERGQKAVLNITARVPRTWAVGGVDLANSETGMTVTVRGRRSSG
jgi:hypothetical protein